MLSYIAVCALLIVSIECKAPPLSRLKNQGYYEGLTLQNTFKEADTKRENERPVRSNLRDTWCPSGFTIKNDGENAYCVPEVLSPYENAKVRRTKDIRPAKPCPDNHIVQLRHGKKICVLHKNNNVDRLVRKTRNILVPCPAGYTRRGTYCFLDEDYYDGMEFDYETEVTDTSNDGKKKDAFDVEHDYVNEVLDYVNDRKKRDIFDHGQCPPGFILKERICVPLYFDISDGSGMH